ncbi:hypothetical protein [Flavobacterium beibuense]|uniref:Alkyl hydroperoxide reductase/ Thiol specific antioxidant/ Mal allergen n=1 Tax=Flavobacterium beibuense TaxID=657326 RepID=A0A444W3Q5_9FLAO|nr:hypothetical protein [Flavobacterium beibuense]RYJ40520.1 Alkyl hydroperoxide reductase/ Thiol specific antioxidant/ Mal allergen [Flavobacterium beibuense]
MKLLFKALLIALILQGCQKSKDDHKQLSQSKPNHFTAENDTLVIRTKKNKGGRFFGAGATSMDFKDTIDTFPYPVVYPKQIQNIKRGLLPTDLHSKTPHYINLMTGTAGKERVFIVDQINNRDFTDDSIRLYRDFEWGSNKDLVQCRYEISNGKQIVKDSSWIKIGNSNNDLGLGKSEYLTADININNKNYKIGASNLRNMVFNYNNSADVFGTKIALLSDDEKVKDTIFERDQIGVGQYIKLNNNHYRFENITNNGEYITLIKDNSFTEKTGTEVGMIAPAFSATTTTGSIINSTDLHDKIIIIVNSCGCGGDVASTQAFFDISNKYGSKVHVIRMDSAIKERKTGTIQIDTELEANKDIYTKYRETYCSHICYVIGKDNRIFDKFIVTNWETDLPKILENSI